MRWAETTSTSWSTLSSVSALEAASITGQSESLPITMPTTGCRDRAASLIDVSSQEGCGVDRPRAHVCSIVADGRDVPDLSPWAHVLAVHVDPHAGVVGEAVEVAGVHLGDLATEHVRHGDPGGGHPGLAERQVQHRTQVLLELAGAGPLDGPVTAVVRAHGQLVDQHAGPGVEHLDGEDAGDPETLGDVEGGPLRGQGVVLADLGGGEDLPAHTVDLHGLDDRVDGSLPVGAARDNYRELAVVVDPLLGQQPAAAGEPVGRLVRLLHQAHAPAVVPAARGLEHHGPADLVAEAPQRLDSVDQPPPRAGHSERR